jgi:hypothetical protein
MPEFKQSIIVIKAKIDATSLSLFADFHEDSRNQTLGRSRIILTTEK